ncbi:hypothetical protein Sango_1742600 [Sesamum angolense]|uniref:GAG-pre-integrase domain-containing protein n=1 Tax=Sesamum angolense TaxID=2727404 RepID=A0AAE2BSE6_9LAMI|nr:hypothetical protein Sango_1742600 [Sesamum angolense]
MQFLMGLNEEYDNVRSQILVTKPLPSINKAYSMILRVERQRQVHMGESLEGATLFARGHDKSTCFKLHEVAEWCKELNEQKKKGVGGANRVNVVQGPEPKLQKEVQSEDKPSMNDIVMVLMKMLKKLPTDPIKASCSEDFAVMSMLSILGVNPLLHHHTLSKSSFTSSIYLPDGTSRQVKQSGYISLSNRLVLKDVLYVPTFQSNLISDRMTSEVVAVAKQTKHLYVLSKQSFDVAFIKSFLPVASNFLSRVIESDALLWHKRLGHPSLKVVEHIPIMKNVVKNAEICTVCPLAKQHRFYGLDTNKLVVSRDVIFHENAFPLQSPSIQAPAITLPLVPNTEVIPDVIRTPTVHISFPQSTDQMSPTSVPTIASPSHVHDPSPRPLRHSTRHVHKPTWMSDYVCNHHSTFSTAHFHFVAQLSVL